MSNENDDSGQAGNWLKDLEKAVEAFARAGAVMQESISQIDLPRIVPPKIDFPLLTVPNSLLQKFENLKPVFKKVAEELAKLPERHKKAAYYLLERSWYLPGFFLPRDTHHIVQLIEAERHEEVEQVMVSKMQEGYPYAKDVILDIFPERRELLEKAFRAHEEGKYALSIPLLLAQADGAHEDVMEAAIYSSSSNRLKAKLVEKLEARGKQSPRESFFYLMFLPLTEEDAPIRENTRSRSTPPPGIPTKHPLNRNGVLHGSDLDYAIEANSLRAIALLYVVADAKRFLDDSME